MKFNLIVRAILAIIFSLMLIWFSMGLFLKDIGSILGCVISVLGLIVIIFWNKIIIICKIICKNLIGKCFLGVFSAILSFGFLYVAIISVFIISAANKKPDTSSTVIVLGCQVNGTTPSLMLENRLKASLDYLNENPHTVCIVSGGRGSHEEISEAQCMYNYLTENGIDAERIILEDKSTTTSENLEFSKRIIEAYGLSKNITIVSNNFHQFRASLIAKKVGLNPTGAISADTPLYLLATYHFRETLAIANELIFG